MRQLQRSLRGFGALIAALLLLSALPAGLAAAAPVVSNCNDSGTGSLRAAIAAAVTGDTITFGVNCPSGAGTQITLASTLTIAQNNLTIDATGHTIVVDGNSAVTVFTVTGGTTAQPVKLNGITIQHGAANSPNHLGPSGGGIANTGTLIVTNSTFTADISSSATSIGEGGGIYNAGTLTVVSCTFSGNRASIGGGGIANDAAGSVLTVTNSTFTGNFASDFPGAGGGIYNTQGATVTNSTFSENNAASGGGIYNTQNATVTNSTFSGNEANAPYGTGGGGINTSGTLTLTNSTLTGNWVLSAPGGNTPGGGILNGGTLTAVNTLIAGNTAVAGPDVSGAFYFTSKNTLLGDPSGSSGISDGDANHNIVGHPAVLGSLGNYGGPTQTVPLLAGSPAIDSGDDATCQNTGGVAPVAGKDQRGVTRPQGPHCDIGAYEAVTTTGPPPTPTNVHVTGATTSTLSWGWTNGDPSANLVVSDGTTATNLAPGDSSFTKSGIAPGGWVCLSVAAWNAAGASGWSPWSCSATVPQMPTGLHVSGATNTGVSFAWTGPDASSAIALGVGTTGGTTYTGLAPGTASSTKAVAAGYWACAQIAAYNASYASAFTPWVCGLAVPNAPTAIHVTGHTSSSVSFAWTDSDPYSGIAVSNGTVVSTVPAGGTTYMQSGMTSGNWVCVSLAAYNVSGVSAWTAASTGWVCGQAGP